MSEGWTPRPGSVVVRGTAVALEGRALLITGPSGAGKSSLAIELISRGLRLVADDAVLVTRDPGGPILGAPPPTRGLIEARGLGLLRAPLATRPARVVAIVDLSREEGERLPPERCMDFHGGRPRILHGVRSPSFAAALHLYLLQDAD